MGIAKRRAREREQLRARIVEAARDIISESGLEALSMRSIAERIEYSPATIYLYFRDKDELLRSVMEEGVQRFAAAIMEEVEVVGPDAGPREQFAATGRAYAIFALEHPSYFRILFELPSTAVVECPVQAPQGPPVPRGSTWESIVEIVQRGIDERQFRLPDASRAAVIGWGLVHGLTSLCLSGHLSEDVASRGDLLDLIEEAMASLYQGWSGGAPDARPHPDPGSGAPRSGEVGADVPVGETETGATS